MMQVFVAVGKAAHIDLPTGVSRALGVKHGDWLRVTVSEDRVALVEPVSVKTPDPLPLPEHGRLRAESEHALREETWQERRTGEDSSPRNL